jgi:hypothetical protein
MHPLHATNSGVCTGALVGAVFFAPVVSISIFISRDRERTASNADIATQFVFFISAFSPPPAADIPCCTSPFFQASGTDYFDDNWSHGQFGFLYCGLIVAASNLILGSCWQHVCVDG